MAMKIGTATKVIISVVGVFVAGFIGLQLRARQIGTHPSETQTSRYSSRSAPDQNSTQGAKKYSSLSERDVESRRDIEEALTWLDNLDKVKPSAAAEPQEILGEEAMSHQISDELRRKVELFDTLMSILPEYEEVSRLRSEASREAADHSNSMDVSRIDADLGSIDYGPDGTKFLNKQGQEIMNDPYLDAFMAELNEKNERIISLVSRERDTLREIDELHPGAVEWLDNSGSTGAPGIIEVNALREYLGKELPYGFRGYHSYSEAQDYNP